MELTQAMYTLVRDYLIAQIMIDNVNRAGVVAFMTEGISAGKNG